MFNIEFYSTADGTSELWDFLDSLQQKSVKSREIEKAKAERDDWISRKG